MSTNLTSCPTNGPSKRTSFHGFPGSGTSLFLEKTKSGLRGSTPDSEALASSDDEQDHAPRLHSASTMIGPKPGRRASWLTENQATNQRKGSLTRDANPPPATPNSGLATGDQAPWATSAATNSMSTGGRGHSSNSSFPWANAIWNNDTQKGPPSRLMEVLPSPKSIDPMASGGSINEEPLLSPLSRESTLESSIPFAIPLQPTLKSYRSQSYSVGQLDPEVVEQPSPHPQNQPFNVRMRSGASVGGLSHRPSRPSMLGDRSHDSSSLGQLREVEDDDESSNDSGAGILLANDQAKTIERLAMENAMLRQAAAQQLEASRARARASTENAMSQYSNNKALRQQPHSQESLRHHQSYAGYTNEGMPSNQGYGLEEASSPRGFDTRTVEAHKKGHWQSSLGFGGLPDIPQSRRHSFAEVPTRQPSISSSGDSPRTLGPSNESFHDAARQASPSSHDDRLVRPSQGESVSYFSNPNSVGRAGQPFHPSSSPTTPLPGYTMASQYSQTRLSTQHQARANQMLYVVTFKACRAEIFYVSEGTGLQIKPGDLVIVEADRGTDLGTVAHDSVTWSKAADLKKHFADEHYRWLMLFSRHGAANAGSNALFSSTPHTGIGMQGLAQQGVQDPSSSDIKPKMIKRLAQPHEIQTLKDKEANEAKAKRVCQQKVAEQHLNMEILDAEFQMDWKKLTFYYFADSYINFNPLVTDLFKIYKTRIWMSAISQLSLPTLSTGLQLPVGQGPGAFTSDSDSYTSQQSRGPSDYSKFNESNLLQPRLRRGAESARDNTVGALNGAQTYGQTYSPLMGSRSIEQLSPNFNQLGQPMLPAATRFGQLPYTNMPVHQVAYGLSGDGGSGQRQNHAGQQEWPQVFQGLSLGP